MLRQKKSALSGIEKTAILMNVLGKDQSLELMKEMKDADVRRLLKVMSSMKKAPRPLINFVLNEFLDKLSEREEMIFEDSVMRPEVISQGLGEERAKQIFGTVKDGNLVERKTLSALDSVDAKSLAAFLIEEHPQTIALVIAHLELPRQIETLRHLPDSLRPEVVLRMANLDYVTPEKVDELDEVLRKELSATGKGHGNPLGGVSTVAELINNLDKKTMNSLMTRLEDRDPVLAEEIRQHMFTFTDLMKIDEKGIQLVLREIPGERLVLALKSAPEELREKIYTCMSERAASRLREDLAALGPQRLTEVEAAQREMVTVARRLKDEGRILIGISDEQEIIP